MAIMDGRPPPRGGVSDHMAVIIVAGLIIGPWVIYHYHWWHALNAWMGWKGWTVVVIYMTLPVLLRPFISFIVPAAILIGFTYLSYILFQDGHPVLGALCLIPWPIVALGTIRLGKKRHSGMGAPTETGEQQ